ncbi:MAG: hypothetical protein A2672_01910 [Candidatus Wildermuthbacteria bacterium RIFCSPHIGHO2_01_FULL_49_22b]|uniref:Uncharacterized protein n=1 Tax=Candidatus Wildermuthbacteria bacterium RIFCSPHIGHO2_01_FULL_49_22b TaxID=1802448 RepID=A0A1G2QXB4_9BACT|nr:MAG: hypothetical protein A2672_01910 [Candidatus Wildermuthbacteria bacterium RIFCSPHIGHO2_01_FULL_49_22b]
MIPTPAPAPLLNLLVHGAVFFLVLSTFIAAAVVWYTGKVKARHMGGVWRMFIFGLFFYTVSEFSDLFTPGLRASLGMHNYFTEFALLTGLSLIFLALRRMVIIQD